MSPDRPFSPSGSGARSRPPSQDVLNDCRSVDHRLMPPGLARFHHIDLAALAAEPGDDGVEADALGLPDPWDATYRGQFRQAFQPVKLWSNANLLASEYETARAGGQDDRVRELRAVMDRLIGRLEEFTVAGEDGAAFVENRFDFVQEGLSIPAPWVGGLSNAFAVLGCCRLHEVLPDAGLDNSVRAYADAFFAIFRAGTQPPRRWISHLDDQGCLWFDEYPQPGGRATLVLNGHIFAIQALHQAAGLWPGRGYDRLVRAGIATVELRFRQFLRRGKPNLYSLGGVPKSDYLPPRTVRQQYELFMLTGADVFLANAMLAAADAASVVDPLRLRKVVMAGLNAMDRRRAFEASRPSYRAFLRAALRLSPAPRP